MTSDQPTASVSPVHSLRRRILTSGGAIMSGFGVSQVLRLISNLILTRLLMPEVFGLMAVALSINIWAVMLTDIGIGSSVIRSPNSEKAAFIRTAWTTQILRNLLVWAIIIFAAIGVYFLTLGGYVNDESIFADPVLPWLMVAMGVQLPISGLGSTNRSLAERRLQMNRVVGLELAQQLFSMVVTIALAVAGFGIWALVIGTLSGALFATILSHFIFAGPRMAWMLDREHFKEIFNFGKWLIIASFFGFILNRGDQLIFGWMMNAQSFSLYAIAAIWVMAAVTVFQSVIGRVFFPAFSEVLREDPDGFETLYKKIRLLLDAAAVAMAIGAYFLAEPIFAIIYPDAFSGVGYYVKLLAPTLLFLPYRLISTAALAAGNSKGFTAVTVIGGIAMVITLPLTMTYIGEKAAIILYASIALVTLPSVWSLGKKLMKLDPMIEGRMILSALLLAVVLMLTT
ncbi:oligosaccharide flippase family protein [Hyphococcus sp. DH-69]|uniref:oligosaccharide flippase family protein n=1 Tax=Hyphococcus formosus TaxID=3143534 RepID=UPI00398A8E9F